MGKDLKGKELGKKLLMEENIKKLILWQKHSKWGEPIKIHIFL